MPLLTTPILPPGSLGGHPQPSITAFDLVLRTWQTADRPVIIAAYSDPEIQRYHTRSMDDAEANRLADDMGASMGAGDRGRMGGD